MSYEDRYIECMSPDERVRNDPSDVYSIIKSLEIRDFFRNHIRLNVFEREQIILKSYIPMQQKINMIKQLALHGTEQEAALLNEHCSFFEKCMADIYQPAKRTIFILEYVDPYFKDGHIINDQYLDGAFDTVEELLNKAESDLSAQIAHENRVRGGLNSESCIKNIEMQSYGYITLLQIPRSGKSKNLFDFTMFRIDGCWQVKDIIMERKDMLSCGFSERAIDQFNWSLVHYPLPFECGSRLKLQTPFMEEPFYGILDSGCGYPGERHHYLWDENVMTSSENIRGLYTRENMKNYVLLFYMEFGACSRYSTLDWVERA